jgi:hypothetical protein
VCAPSGHRPSPARPAQKCPVRSECRRERRVPCPRMLCDSMRCAKGKGVKYKGKWPVENGHAGQICMKLSSSARHTRPDAAPASQQRYGKLLVRSPLRASHRSTKVTTLVFRGAVHGRCPPTPTYSCVCVCGRPVVIATPPRPCVRGFPRPLADLWEGKTHHGEAKGGDHV